ncbi:CoA transferase [Sulfitobacter sp.]|uniref:CoA transferase n=1 Tax=Sulfitobacter sp. TaxID=1903071 RepID=UPI000C11F566|nr:hypothetical protein [Roseobacter sp.]MBV49379.1 hypothetical protein [Roseobacter sp.]PHR09418.1 MAG: hypothetical protein COB29_04505 [Sulfitobacter sp.]
MRKYSRPAPEWGYAALDILLRSRTRIAVGLKSEKGISALRDLIATADRLVQGFRQDVMARLGSSPDDVVCIDPNHFYGRMTGCGQTGPYAQRAGHDINDIALSRALHAFGRKR